MVMQAIPPSIVINTISAAFEGAVPDFEFSIKAFFLEIEGYKSHHLPTGKFIFFPVEGVSDVHGSPRSGIQIRFVDNIIFISDRVQGDDFMTMGMTINDKFGFIVFHRLLIKCIFNVIILGTLEFS